ncbi:aldehyde dehydrogenase family protein [Dietzia sp.]|uniref:aldehyde dehydrogenase family protein n=1 Tax=Dietzia sp. TaxID=1871616 RepID=UPI002FD8EDDD
MTTANAAQGVTNTGGAAPRRGTTARDLSLAEILEIQKRAQAEDPQPTAKVRRDRISRLKQLVLDNAKDFAEAIRDDYGSRPETLSTLTDIAASMPDLDHQRSHVAKWMRSDAPSRVLSKVGFHQEVRHDPKGVVGIMGPWNFPLYLTIVPAGSALGAGNRVMIRSSSSTPRTTELLCELGPKYFPVEELVFAGPEHGRGSEFSKLDFDHLFFTGSPGVGRSVAKDAAENLTPVTLELGGKNPVLVDPEADIAEVAANVAASRMVNGGQVCVCPDYALVPRDKVEAFADAVLETWTKKFGAISGNPEYTTTINESNFERICGLIDDARAKGATVRQVVPAGEDLPNATERKIAPTVLTDLGADMDIEDDEVFGPILSVYPYDDIVDAVAQINARPDPLVLYWYGERGPRFDYAVGHTRSGNVYGNNFGMGMVSSAVPFGGSGNSGMGSYHGKWGFDTFSRDRAVAMSEFDYNVGDFMTPPFDAAAKRQADLFLKAMKTRTRFLG